MSFQNMPGGLTRNTAVEYGESGIRINICGLYRTPLLRESVPEEERAHLPVVTPLIASALPKTSPRPPCG